MKGRKVSYQVTLLQISLESQSLRIFSAQLEQPGGFMNPLMLVTALGVSHPVGVGLGPRLHFQVVPARLWCCAPRNKL